MSYVYFRIQDVPKEDEVALQAALAKYGPVSVAIEADQMGFQFYSGGVFDGSLFVSFDIVSFSFERQGLRCLLAKLYHCGDLCGLRNRA